MRCAAKNTQFAEAMVCPKCRFQALTDAQSAAYTIAIADAYRMTHGLLTTRGLEGGPGALADESACLREVPEGRRS